MNNPNRLDRNALQQLFLNASGENCRFDPAALRDFSNIQQSFSNGKLDLNEFMNHVLELTRNVASAAGAAIALFDGDLLTYWAGSGNCESCVGRPVAPTLLVSADAWKNNEILRIEDVELAPPTEADICQQLDAKALLILPIHYEQSVIGVMEVGFGGPHTFQEAEVHAYHWLSEQLESAIAYCAQIEAQQEIAEVPSEGATASLEEVSISAAPTLAMSESEESAFVRCVQTVRRTSELCAAKLASLGAVAIAGAKKLDLSKRGRVLVTSTSEAFSRRLKNLNFQSRWQKIDLEKPSPTVQEKADNSPANQLFAEFSKLLQQANRLASNWKAQASQAILRLKQRARDFTWPKRRSNFPRPAFLASLAEQATNLGKWLQTLEPNKMVSSLSQRAKSFPRPQSERFDATSYGAVLRRKAKDLNWSGRLRDFAPATIAVVLTLVVLMAYRDRSPAKPVESSVRPLPPTSASRTSVPKPSAVTDASSAALQKTVARTARATNNSMKKVRVGTNEVDYISDDVTVRTFTTSKPAVKKKATNGRETNIGDDVTVRYFAPQKAQSR